MKQLLKTIIPMLSWVTLLSTLSLADNNFTPIIVDDIVTFVSYSAGNDPLPAIKPIKTVQDSYGVNDTVSIMVNTQLSGDEDWVGVFRVGDNNDWGNVIAWNFVNNGTTLLTRDQKPMPAGTYEIRLFFHNEYGANATVRATYMFTVEGVAREFGTEGPHLSKVKWVKTTDEDGTVIDAIYYVEGEVNLPTVIFMSGWKSDLESYDGFLTYIASLGYCVVAKQERGKCFTPNVYNQELSEQLTAVHNTYNADITKLGILGHSSGGGTVHYLMNYFKSNNIAGNTKSVVMSIDGWFPFGTTEAMLNSFVSPTLLIQFGGLDGINKNDTHPDWDDYPGEPYHHYQDPKINMAIFKSLTHLNVDKEYVVLEADNHHSYIAGNYDTVITKTDVLAPIDEFLNHILGTGAPMTLINHYDDVITYDLASEYQYYCHTAGFDFCDLDNLTFP